MSFPDLFSQMQFGRPTGEPGFPAPGGADFSGLPPYSTDRQPVWPVAWALTLGSGATGYVASDPIPFPFAIVGIASQANFFNGAAGAAAVNATFRTTNDLTTDATAFSTGQPLWPSFGQTDTFAISSSWYVGGLWIPILDPRRRIITQLVNSAGYGVAFSFSLQITPLMPGWLEFAPPPPPACGCHVP